MFNYSTIIFHLKLWYHVSNSTKDANGSNNNPVKIAGKSSCVNVDFAMNFLLKYVCTLSRVKLVTTTELFLVSKLYFLELCICSIFNLLFLQNQYCSGMNNRNKC